MAKIPLTPLPRTAGPGLHPFPLRISLQTQEILLATLFHAAFADIAAGEFVRQPEGVHRAEELMKKHGLEAGEADDAWSFLIKYQLLFEGALFQSALIAFNSEWDWYIRKLSEFIRIARRSCGGPLLTAEDEKRLRNAGRLPLLQQLEIVQAAAGVTLPLGVGERSELLEMSLVRNLGLHNRWEIDADYLKKTPRLGFIEGNMRVLDLRELHDWQSLLIKLLNSSATECAKRFHAAPEFNI
jgi:hypothetical protein